MNDKIQLTNCLCTDENKQSISENRYKNDIMKVSELLSASPDAEIKVENGEITIVEPKPIEYKFKVGDKVRDTINPELIYTVIGQFAEDGGPMYNLRGSWGETSITEKRLLPIPQDITERIKTFEDACKWCENNGRKEVVGELEAITYCNPCFPSDILAYLKLRVITCALNEGWKPTYEDDEQRWYVYYDTKLMKIMSGYEDITHTYQTPASLLFKSQKLAEYAEKQFTDCYLKFGGLL